MAIMRILASLFSKIIIELLPSGIAYAHCDTLNGPLIAAARKALETGNENYVLIWVKAEREKDIKEAFKQAMDNRGRAQDQKEKEAADMSFFEILVRAHREGEGAEYSGIKPAGEVEPEIALADEAVETMKIDKVLEHIESRHNKELVSHLFHKLEEGSHYQIDDISAGRKFIETYAIFVHAVEKALKGEHLDETGLHNH